MQNHTYAIVGLDEGGRSLKLCNPWGTSTSPENPQELRQGGQMTLTNQALFHWCSTIGAGCFSVEFSSFLEQFDVLHLCKP